MLEQQCLYHFPIDPFCRKIRFMLALNDVQNCYLRIENFWEKRPTFCKINPTGTVPLLAVQKHTPENKKIFTIWGQNTIMDYLRNKYPVFTLLHGDIDERAKIMKYSEFFDSKFHNDVVKLILEERVYTFYKKKRVSNVDIIKLARLNLEQYLTFIETILKQRDYIATSEFSLADLSLATHISSLDYLGEIDWTAHTVIKEWYAIIKSKPAFREILYDIIADFRPSSWYRELDF